MKREIDKEFYWSRLKLKKQWDKGIYMIHLPEALYHMTMDLPLKGKKIEKAVRKMKCLVWVWNRNLKHRGKHWETLEITTSSIKIIPEIWLNLLDLVFKN